MGLYLMRKDLSMTVVSATPSPWAITKGAYGALHVGPARLDHPGKARIEYAADRGHDLLAGRDADARLIAAAPEMLAALKTALDTFEWAKREQGRMYKYSVEDLCDVVAAAIARVEGGAA